jgi:hypothetical protein
MESSWRELSTRIPPSRFVYMHGLKSNEDATFPYFQSCLFSRRIVECRIEASAD